MLSAGSGDDRSRYLINKICHLSKRTTSSSIHVFKSRLLMLVLSHEACTF